MFGTFIQVYISYTLIYTQYYAYARMGKANWAEMPEGMGKHASEWIGQLNLSLHL